MNAPLEWAPLFTAEKFNKRPGLKEHPSQTRKWELIWKFSMSAEALIQIVCKNDETRVFFNQIVFVFYNKEIYKHIIIKIIIRNNILFSLQNDIASTCFEFF